MRNRSELLARLAKDRVALTAARHRAAMMWRDHPAREALRHLLDECAVADVEVMAGTIVTHLAKGDPVAGLMADLGAMLEQEPFFDPPCATIDDEVHRGIVILDHPVAIVTLSVASADRIAARKALGHGAGSVGTSGAVSVIRFHRAGGARLRFWHCEGATCSASGAPQACRDDDVLIVDGRSRGFVIESCESDIVMLRVTLKRGQAAMRREYDAASGALVGVASNDEAASRSQMLLTLLRIAGRQDAADCFHDAIASETHFLRWHAMREYLALAPAAALPLLRRMATHDPHDEVRLAAHATLETFAARNSDNQPKSRCRA
ncbi:hypothetical protein [Sphingomonas cavernae]|uniref:HEAT repeat domain-containing protein n=1 Tax=Sphingomonas cavernae TaxID=2320861 RepID=A0A418W786_9SPHN|nr:hypothetical protein [Sphingomonas cavernae]RJF85906.1 hypothetical protein D3876_18825 [Sphingomonas cavernae]